jgi:hypothetical protein
VAATGVGAPVAAEAGASVLDAAADFALTGELPDMTALALAFAENVLAKKISKLTGMLPWKRNASKKDIHHADPQAQAARSQQWMGLHWRLVLDMHK